MGKIRLIVVAGAVLTLPVAASSCLMTKDEGKIIERDLRTTQDEMLQLRQQQQKSDQERAAQIDQLKTAVTQADETGRRSDADVFLKMDGLVQQVQQLTGRVEQLEHRLAEIEARQARPPAASQPTSAAAAPGTQLAAGLGGTAASTAPSLPTDKKELYDLGKRMQDEGKYEEARRILRHFVSKFPDDAALSDNALFWIGEGHFKEGTYDKAILTFQEVINKYPQSDKLDAALYKIGRSFESLGLKDDALLFFEDLVAKFPKSAHVADAKKRIQTLKKPNKKDGKEKKKEKPVKRTG